MHDQTLDSLRSIILTHYPTLSSATFTLHDQGWDSLAVDADDRIIFKFPRDAAAAASLRVEASLLAHVRPAVAMPVPDLALVEGPPLFSRHEKISGSHLVAADYANLVERERVALADALAQFYAQLHALDIGTMRAAGAHAVETWLTPDVIRARAWPLVREPLRPLAERVLDAWEHLPRDPHGDVYGYFDGHGWNMAFDHARGRLNGIYDFGDSGIGAVHREFIYSNFISNDLTSRIVAAYERITRRTLDRARIDILTGAFRLHELAAAAIECQHLDYALGFLDEWAAQPHDWR
jgi:Ser/Thr protein kinase RdoA (MazF antagonist)